MAKDNSLDSLLYDIRRISEHREKLTDEKIEKIHKSLTKSLNTFLSEQYIEYADKDGRLYMATLDGARKKAWFLNEIAKNVDSIQPELRKEITSLIDDTYSKAYKGIVDATAKADTAKKYKEVAKELKVHPDRLKQTMNNNISKLTLPQVLERNRADLTYRIQQELTIGLANGDRYEQMVSRIQKQTNFSEGKSKNIVRTETHRNTESGLFEGALEAGKDLEEEGFIYAATWRTRKDERVRPQYVRKSGKKWKHGINKSGANHMIMEGVTVKVGEEFDLKDGAKAKFPGDSGEARHDCNCRCFLEYNIMTPEEFAKATNQSVKDVCSKYNIAYKGNEKVETKEDKPKEVKPTTAEPTKVQLDSFPDVFKTGTAKKQTQTFVNYLNNLDNADPDMLKIYNSIGKLESIDKNGIPLKLSYTKDKHSVSYSSYRYNGSLAEVKVKLPKMKGDDLTGAAQTTAHELGHFIDLSLRKDVTKAEDWFTTTKGMTAVLDKSRGDASDEVLALFKSSNKLIEDTHDAINKEYRQKIAKYKADNKDLYENSFYDYNAFKTYKKGLKKLYDEQDEMLDYATRNAMNGVNNFTDIYDALSKGKYRDTGVIRYGHGSKYYRSTDNQIEEIWANYCALSMTRPDLIEMLRRDKPELVKALDDIKADVLKKVGEIK